MNQEIIKIHPLDMGELIEKDGIQSLHTEQHEGRELVFLNGKVYEQDCYTPRGDGDHFLF